MLKEPDCNGPLSAEIFKGDREMSAEEFVTSIYQSVEKITALAK